MSTVSPLGLRRRWEFAFDEMDLAVPSFGEIIGRYQQQHRHYHDLTHPGNVMLAGEKLCGGKLPVPVTLASFYHDAVYVAGSDRNEIESAHMALDDLTTWGVPGYVVSEVSELIVVTARSAFTPRSYNEALFHDADFAILAATRQEYGEYAGAIRREFSQLTDAEWASGRSKFLLGQIKQPTTFFLPQAQWMNELAKRNMESEINRLVNPHQ